MTSISQVTPREVAGRDTTLRFSMQHQAAAYAALEVLEAGEVDRVYCDFHDDFVVRRRAGALVTYHFFQVKTKGKMNHQWSLAEVFSLKKKAQASDQKSLNAIRQSFAGKLFQHSIQFKDACGEVTLLTNVHFDNDVEAAVKELRESKPTSKPVCFLIERFGEIFEISIDKTKVLDAARKLSLMPNVAYIGEDSSQFLVAAREAVHRYSEIDLTRTEAAEIATGLVALVARKSMGSLEGLSPEDLDESVGIGIDDLLSILSISPASYRALLSGADPKALKNASFIQRGLSVAGASESMIEFASRQKVEWDIWVRTFRHTYPEFEFNFLLQRVDQLRLDWLTGGGKIEDLRVLIDGAHTEKEIGKFASVTKELLLGAVIASWVRRDSA